MHISSNADHSGEHVKYAATCQKDLGSFGILPSKKPTVRVYLSNSVQSCNGTGLCLLMCLGTPTGTIRS